MLRKLEDLNKFAIHATDGVVGKVKDFYFDDQSWVVRYLVVETGNWLDHRRVLISPMSIGATDRVGKMLSASITMQQIRNSPDIDTAKPVSRQHESEFLGYYGYPPYWGLLGNFGITYPNVGTTRMPEFVSTPQVVLPVPDPIELTTNAVDDAPPMHNDDDPHLRSSDAVQRYHVRASDGEVGHVEGLLVDEQTWAIHHLIVNTSNWWLGHLAMIAPQSIREVDWADETIVLDLDRQQVKDAPHFDPDASVREPPVETHYSAPR
ncbi:MAG: PRC-barrel domain-containing protein [Lysobacteraceae bacterium]